MGELRRDGPGMLEYGALPDWDVPCALWKPTQARNVSVQGFEMISGHSQQGKWEEAGSIYDSTKGRNVKDCSPFQKTSLGSLGNTMEGRF